MSFIKITLAVAFITIMPLCATEIIWDPEVPISRVDDTTSSTSWSAQRSMAVGQDGRIHVVWTDSRTPPYPEIHIGIWYSSSGNGGITWSIPRCISEPLYGGGGLYNFSNTSPSIAVLNYGQVHAFWDGLHETFTHSYAIYGVSTNNGSTWNFPVDPVVWEYWATEPPSGFNSLCGDGDNYLLFYDQQWVPNFFEYRILGCWSTNGGGADWSEAQWHGFSTINKSDRRPCTACDSNDTGYLVWESIDNNNKAIILFGTSVGFSGDEYTLVPYPGAGSRTEAFIESDLDGNLFVVWSDSRDGNSEIYFKKSTDNGSTWSSDTGLTNAVNASRQPSIALGNTNGLYLVWVDNRNGTEGLFFKYSEDGGSTWSADTCLISGPAACGHPHIAIAPDKMNIYLLWNDERDGQSEVYFKRGTINIGVSESEQIINESILDIRPSIFKGQVNFHISKSCKGSHLAIYDASGRVVKIFNDDLCNLDNSVQSVSWDGTDNNGHQIPPGIYFVRLQTPEKNITRKIIKIK
jgi:hypothetical protein